MKIDHPLVTKVKVNHKVKEKFTLQINLDSKCMCVCHKIWLMFHASQQTSIFGALIIVLQEQGLNVLVPLIDYNSQAVSCMWTHESIVKWSEEAEWSKWLPLIKSNKSYTANKMASNAIKAVERKERMSCSYL